MFRLFVGTFLPPADQSRLEAVRAQNAQLDESWNCKVRWIKPSKLHLTWLFIGEVEDQAIEGAKTSLAKAVGQWRQENANTVPQVAYDKVECWPGERRSKVMVLTPGQVEDAVYTLADAVKSNLLQHCPKDKVDRYIEHYRPHLTIARFDHQSKSTRVRVAELQLPQGLLPLTHVITNVSLIQSRLGSKEDYLTLSQIDLT